VSVLQVYPLPYKNDLVSHYQSFSNLPGYVLLESRDHQHGRYDILTALPYDALNVTRQSANLHEALQQLQNKLLSVPSMSDLPFQGGAIGYISYDFGAMLAGIISEPHPLNDMPLVDIKFYDWAIVVDHHCRQVHLVVAHQKPDTKHYIKDILTLWESQGTHYPPFLLCQKFSPLIREEDYRLAFEAIHQTLMQGRAYQVNYTQPFVGRYRGDSWEMYKKIRSRNRVPYAAFIRGLEGDVLSFSPERFLCIDKGVALTSPIKGTTPRSSHIRLDNEAKAGLLASEKNRAENVMIVDLLRNDLGKFSKPSSVQVTALCELQSFKAVHHLVSTIQSQCKDNITLSEAFAACFPGGSITGAPKRESMRIIQEYEPFSRGIYCGSITYFSNHGRLDSNIAIRTVTAKDDSLYLSAGGGIVIDSGWKDEYRECFTKIAAIVNAC